MAKLIVRDKKGELEKIANRIIKKKKDFRILSKLNILFVWRLGDVPVYDDENQPVAATTRKLPVRERDVYGKDVEIAVFKQSWRRRNKRAKYILIFHELLHIEVEQDEAFKANRDDDGRIIFKTIPHDIVIKGFKREYKEFGLPSRDVGDAMIVTKFLKRRKKKKKKGK